MIYPAQLDMTVLQGATFYKQITWTTGSGAPFDLTGAEIRMQARYAAQAPEVLIDASTNNGSIVIEDALNGVFAISLHAIDTDDFQFPSAVYDLEVELSDGTVYRPIQGKITVIPQVTR